MENQQFGGAAIPARNWGHLGAVSSHIAEYRIGVSKVITYSLSGCVYGV